MALKNISVLSADDMFNPMPVILVKSSASTVPLFPIELKSSIPSNVIFRYWHLTFTRYKLPISYMSGRSVNSSPSDP